MKLETFNDMQESLRRNSDRPCHLLLGSVFLAVFSLMTHAADIEIPELGLQIPNVPEGSSASNVRHMLDADSAVVKLGTGQLSIYRLSEAVPAGASFSDEAYRNRVQADFNDRLGKGSRGQATSVTGHPAWTMFQALRLSPFPIVAYTCITYVIVDEHLYRFRTDLTAQYDNKTPNTKPPELLPMLRAMSDATFSPITAPAATSIAADHPRMPRFVPDELRPYPAVATRRGETGTVDIECKIDASGHVRDVKVLHAASRSLTDASLAYLKDGVFRVTPAWEQNGWQMLPLIYEFRWALTRGGQCPELASGLPGVKLTEVIGVCGSALP